jgi:electron transfer flavoprotein alpha subunit
MEKEISVLVEHRDGEIEEATLEVLSDAWRLANKARLKVSVIVLGHPAEPIAPLLSGHGADKVYVSEHPLLERYTTDGYMKALTDILKIRDPAFFLLAATSLGRDLAPRLATRLQVGLVSDCRVLDINKDGMLEMTRPSLGGRVYNKIIGGQEKIQIATVKPGVLGIGKFLKGRTADIEQIDIEIPPEIIRNKVKNLSKVNHRDLDISEAEYVLAFGRGLGNAEHISQMEELADALGASIAGSRAAVDERWIPYDRQIGQTGKIISPKVIVCCGISGAQQFTMGMQDSRFIVAINTDRRAPIFKVADVPAVGDLNAIVPELAKRYKVEL